MIVIKAGKDLFFFTVQLVLLLDANAVILVH